MRKLWQNRKSYLESNYYLFLAKPSLEINVCVYYYCAWYLFFDSDSKRHLLDLSWHVYCLEATA